MNDNDYFSISSLLKTIDSKKTRNDFRKSEIFQDLLEIDKQAIIGDQCKKKYYRTVLYWAEPTYAVFIENGEEWKEYKKRTECNKLKGIIYLVKISDNLYKFGRTENMRKRINQYPRGSTIVKYEEVSDMFRAEKILLNCASESNGKLYTGNEFYFYEDETEPLRVFNVALERLSKPGI